jgi:hypothetical protein
MTLNHEYNHDTHFQKRMPALAGSHLRESTCLDRLGGFG